MGLFDHRKYGFFKQPVDFMYATMSLQVKNKIGFERYNYGRQCQGVRLIRLFFGKHTEIREGS